MGRKTKISKSVNTRDRQNETLLSPSTSEIDDLLLNTDENDGEPRSSKIDYLVLKPDENEGRLAVKTSPTQRKESRQSSYKRYSRKTSQEREERSDVGKDPALIRHGSSTARIVPDDPADDSDEQRAQTDMQIESAPTINDGDREQDTITSDLDIRDSRRDARDSKQTSSDKESESATSVIEVKASNLTATDSLITYAIRSDGKRDSVRSDPQNKKEEAVYSDPSSSTLTTKDSLNTYTIRGDGKRDSVKTKNEDSARYEVVKIYHKGKKPNYVERAPQILDYLKENHLPTRKSGRYDLPNQNIASGGSSRQTAREYIAHHRLDRIFHTFLSALIDVQPSQPVEFLHQMAREMNSLRRIEKAFGDDPLLVPAARNERHQ